MTTNDFYFNDDDGRIRPLADLDDFCRQTIEAAEAAGLVIDDGNVVDLIADNCNASLRDIREALVYAGFAQRFPQATQRNREMNKSEPKLFHLYGSMGEGTEQKLDFTVTELDLEALKAKCRRLNDNPKNHPDLYYWIEDDSGNEISVDAIIARGIGS